MNACRELYIKANVDVIVVLGESNTYYMSGFKSSNCQIVITQDEQYFITDKRYINEAKIKLSDRFLVLAGDMDTIEGIVGKANTIGWDSCVPYTTYKELANTFGESRLKDVSSIINNMRMFKTKAEIANIRKAQEITELGFDEALKNLKEGVSEIEIAAIIEYTFLKNGAQLAFDSIVAFGENGATPHAHRTNRQLQPGDFITMDIGAKWNGYCSDMTRTVAFGGISRKQAEIYNTVLLAQETAENKIRAGMTGYEADKIARDIIVKKGYGEYFTHSLGHSVGIDIHEPIFLSPKADNQVIENGMVITVEPGIYIPQLCGVRIEDTVIIEDNKAISIAKSNKKLIIL